MRHIPGNAAMVAAMLCLLACGTSGCVASLFCAKTLNAGVVEYYADFSDIMDDTIYKCGNRYYVFAREVGYHPSLSQFALIMVPISYAESSLNRIEVPQRYAVIEISSNYADYLSGPELNNAYDLNAEGVAFYGAINLSEAEKLPLRNRPSPPLITQMDGSFDIMENTVFIRKEKALSSWWLLPVVPAALAVDVPVSAAATVLFDGVALPGIVLFKGTMTLAGIYDQPDNTIETHVSTPATMPSR